LPPPPPPPPQAFALIDEFSSIDVPVQRAQEASWSHNLLWEFVAVQGSTFGGGFLFGANNFGSFRPFQAAKKRLFELEKGQHKYGLKVSVGNKNFEPRHHFWSTRNGLPWQKLGVPRALVRKKKYGFGGLAKILAGNKFESKSPPNTINIKRTGLFHVLRDRGAQFLQRRKCLASPVNAQIRPTLTHFFSCVLAKKAPNFWTNPLLAVYRAFLLEAFSRGVNELQCRTDHFCARSPFYVRRTPMSFLADFDRWNDEEDNTLGGMTSDDETFTIIDSIAGSRPPVSHVELIDDDNYDDGVTVLSSADTSRVVEEEVYTPGVVNALHTPLFASASLLRSTLQSLSTQESRWTTLDCWSSATTMQHSQSGGSSSSSISFPASIPSSFGSVLPPGSLLASAHNGDDDDDWCHLECLEIDDTRYIQVDNEMPLELPLHDDENNYELYLQALDMMQTLDLPADIHLHSLLLLHHQARAWHDAQIATHKQKSVVQGLLLGAVGLVAVSAVHATTRRW